MKPSVNAMQKSWMMSIPAIVHALREIGAPSGSLSIVNTTWWVVLRQFKFGKLAQINKKLWLVIADFRSAPLKIETEDNKLVREEPAGSDLFQFALARPTGSTEWLLGRATAYQDDSG
jgi:hypothetical protein